MALRQKILNIHYGWPRRLVGKDLAAMSDELQLLERSLLAELRDIGRAGEPGFLEEREQDNGGNTDKKSEMLKREIPREKAGKKKKQEQQEQHG